MRASPSQISPVLVVLAELVGAVLGGAAFAALGYLLPFPLLAGAGLGMGLLAIQIFSAIVGFGVGAGLGTALAGRLLGQRGRAWLAVASAAASAAAVILVMRLLNLGDLRSLVAIAVALTLVGAVAGYNIRRR